MFLEFVELGFPFRLGTGAISISLSGPLSSVRLPGILSARQTAVTASGDVSSIDEYNSKVSESQGLKRMCYVVQQKQ